MGEVSPVQSGGNHHNPGLGELTERALGGDTDAFAALAERLRSPVGYVVRRLLGEGCERDDAVQDTLVEVWRRLGELRDPAAVASWACRIARTVALRRLRSHWPPSSPAEEAWLAARADPLPSPEEIVVARLAMESALGRLCPSQRAVVELCALDGLAIGDAAELLGLAPAVVKGRLQRARAALREEHPAMPKKTPAPPLVAVVDDEPHIVDLVVHYLEAAGYRACSAPDGRTGLELIAREKPSCVVLDILMPFLDGRSVLRRLRSNAATVSLPVLILSGTDPDDPANAICGELAQGFIRKPFHPGHVVKGVRQVLGCPPDIAKALATIHAFRFLGEGDPMELVALYRSGDPELVYEVPRALGERPEEGLPALLALREPGLLLAVDGPHVVPALTELLDDPDPLLAFHALSALQLHAELHSPTPRRSPHGSAVFGPRSEAQATVSSERFADIVGSAVAALGKLEPDERRVLLHQLHAFEGTYVTELLRAIAEDDRHELGALARRLLEQRAMPCYPPQLVLAT